MSTQHRKKDAHEKIQLGGLVNKAGLRDADKSVVLGALLEVAEAIDNDNREQIKRWRSAGKQAFATDQ